MNTGKTLFAQLMDFLPWSTFARLVARYDGDRRCGRFPVPSNFGPWPSPNSPIARACATSRPVWRRNLQALPHGLPRARAPLHAGRRQRNSRLAHLRRLCPTPDRAGQEALRRRYLGLDLDNTVYALDSTTIDLCLSVFPWAHFRHQGRSEDAHAAGSAWQHPELHPCLRRQAARCQRSICCFPSPVRSTSWIAATSISRVFTCCIRPAPSSSPAPNRIWMPTGSIRRRPIADRHHLRSDHRDRRPPHRQVYPEHLRRIRFKDPETGKPLIFLTNQ